MELLLAYALQNAKAILRIVDICNRLIDAEDMLINGQQHIALVAGYETSINLAKQQQKEESTFN